MTDLENILAEDISKDHDYVVALRRYFHENAELSAKEYITQEKIEEELDKLSIEHKRVAGTGVYAEIKGEKPGNKVIVLRADIDALPVTETNDVPYRSRFEGVKHACGHDAHNASLLGAARALSRHRDIFGGTVRLIWQPGEEIGYGARIIVDEGYVDGADRTFGIHLASGKRAGTVGISAGPQNASVDQFTIKVKGHSAHIATPQFGVDASYICAQILIGIQSLVTRMSDPMETLLIGIGRISAGTAYNVIAGEGELEGTIRAFSQDLRAATKKRIEELSVKTAEIYGGSVEFFWKDNTSPLINDEASVKEARRTAVSLLGQENVTEHAPDLGGDDMAEFIIRVPGVYVFVGSNDPDRPDTCRAHHDSRFDIDEDSLRVGALMYACYAVEFLEGINEKDQL